MSGRPQAERDAKQAVDTSDRLPLGSATLRQDRDGTEHYLIRFPFQLVSMGEFEPGEELEQYYNPDENRLEIPLDD